MTTEKVKYGVHSEAGKLRKVMVCSPGLAHQRLTPNNCDELLFDDVLWVAQAKRDHFDFVTKMRERGIEPPTRRVPMPVVDAAPAFVQLPLAPAAPDIRIEIRRGNAVIKVDWPVQASGDCAAWLRDWLR